MSTLSFRITNATMSGPIFAEFCDEVQRRLEDLTPVDTGFAQASWHQNFTPTRCDFINDAVYISFLDEGWSSQAPNGMTKPVLDQLSEIASIFR